MFSASVELLLGVAYREATSRRHTHLTLEHLLYVLAHDTEAERILAELNRLRRARASALNEVAQSPRDPVMEPLASKSSSAGRSVVPLLSGLSRT